MGKYSHIIDVVLGQPLLMRPEKVESILELLQLRAFQDVRFSAEEIEARIGAAPVRKAARKSGTVAVLPLYGVIAQRMNIMQQMSGGTSTQQFTQAFRSALNDDEVKAILLDVDSPGGSVYGVAELAQEIFEARGRKPIAAIANSEMASAAYWIASAAESVYITPGGMAGSIGVVTIHEDWSENLASEGVKVTIITAGKHKAEGNPYEPLQDDARDYIQGMADEYYGMFTGAVARNRGVPASTARGAGFGQGRMLMAKQAKATGMVDGIMTFDQLVARLGGNAEAKASTTPADPSMVPHGEDREWVFAEMPPVEYADPHDTTTDHTHSGATHTAPAPTDRSKAERLMEIALAGGR